MYNATFSLNIHTCRTFPTTISTQPYHCDADLQRFLEVVGVSGDKAVKSVLNEVGSLHHQLVGHGRGNAHHLLHKQLPHQLILGRADCNLLADQSGEKELCHSISHIAYNIRTYYIVYIARN